jgi:hypothetical protein
VKAVPVPITRRAYKPLIFDGTAGKGAIGNVPLFNVTGHVLIITLTPYCVVAPTGTGATMSLGVTGAPTFWIGATTMTDLVAGEYWYDTTPTETNAFLIPAGFKDVHVNANIIGTVATAAVTGGRIDFVLYWEPISPDGLVVPA